MNLKSIDLMILIYF